MAREADDVEGAALLEERGIGAEHVLDDLVGRLDAVGDRLEEGARGVEVGRQALHRQEGEEERGGAGLDDHLVGGEAQVHERHLTLHEGVERRGDAVDELACLDSVEGTLEALVEGLAHHAVAHLEHAVGVAHERARQEGVDGTAGHGLVQAFVELALVRHDVTERHGAVTLLNNSFFHRANQSSEHARRARKTNR